ncbi:MAG: hypothetical protein QF437_26100, partial [Planctomycetota bacterium]|nr:hypothetical protein [Planctomycetota bacterium]
TSNDLGLTSNDLGLTSHDLEFTSNDLGLTSNDLGLTSTDLNKYHEQGFLVPDFRLPQKVLNLLHGHFRSLLSAIPAAP